MNKGIVIWLHRKKKVAKRRYTIKENQVGLVRVVTVKYPTFKKVNGKNRFDKMEAGLGVQVENRIYFAGRYIYANKAGVRIKEIKNHSKVPKDILEIFYVKTKLYLSKSKVILNSPNS